MGSAEPSEYQPGLLRDLGLLPRAIRLTFQPKGRSRRTELFVLMAVPLFAIRLIDSGLGLAGIVLDLNFVWGIVGALVLLPVPACAARRLHDQNLSAWFALPIVVLCAIGMWSRIAVGVEGSDLAPQLFNNWIAENVIVALKVIYAIILLQPPVDGGNRFGPNPRL